MTPEWSVIIEGIVAIGLSTTFSMNVTELIKKLPLALVHRYKCLISICVSLGIAYGAVSNIPALNTINSTWLHEVVAAVGAVVVTSWSYNMKSKKKGS